MAKSLYAKAGVDMDAGEQFVDLICARVKAAWPDIAKNIGGFAGDFQLQYGSAKGVACTDGSGTVAVLCALTGTFDVLGQNAAAMSLVDAYVAGSLPVALLDVIDVAKLNPKHHIGVIDGLITGCKMTDPQCRLIGGETAELPDIFKEQWMLNVNTTAIGIKMPDIVTNNVCPGQNVIGWPSHGFGSNGFSLLRTIFRLKGDYKQARRRLAKVHAALGETLADALLRPAPIWVEKVEDQRMGGVLFAAHAHITGGGLVSNIPRVLPPHCKVVIDRNMIERQPIFALAQRMGKIPDAEMDRVFNQGVMMVSIVDNSGKAPLSAIARTIGQVEKRKRGEPQVQFINNFRR